MQKKIIALAIASALTAPALAFAEATVYGQVNLAVESVNDGATSSTTNNQLNSYGSRFGLKGSEALDGGMSIVWMLEGNLAADTGSTSAPTLFDRASQIGLKSDSMGTVLLGRQVTPYKGATRRLDLFGDSAADTRNNGAAGLGHGHDVDAPNAVSYSSPSMSGLSVTLASVFGAETAQVRGGIADTKGSALGFNVMYDQGPLYVTLAYDSAKAGSPGSGDLAAAGLAGVNNESKVTMIGGSYSMDAITVNADIEKFTDKDLGGSRETTGTNLYLGGKFALSSTDAVKLAYTKLGETTTGGTKNADDAKRVAVGYDHSMSKMTSVYALYTKFTDNKSGNPDPSVLSVGIKHAF